MLGRLKRKFFDPKKALLKVLGDVELPTFPAVVSQALDRLRNPDTSMREIGDLVAEDPGLTVKLLKTANSSLYSLRHPARTVQHAVGLLGRAQVESVLLTVAVGNVLPGALPGFDPARFWSAAAFRAAVAKALAVELQPGTQAEVFTAALLQDLALPLLLQHRGHEYQGVFAAWQANGGDLCAHERQHFGWDHAEVAMLLCHSWGFSEALTIAIGGHHASPAEADDVPIATRLAGVLAGTDDAREVAALNTALNEELGWDESKIDEFWERVRPEAEGSRASLAA